MHPVVQRVFRSLACCALLLPALAVQAQTCSIPGQAGAATITTQPNSFFPGSANAAAGATSITVGAGTGVNSPIQAGDLLLVIQMQGADINTSNGRQYGDGTGNTGTVTTAAGNTVPYATGGTNNYAGGATNVTAGTYEWAVASGGNATFGAGGTINLTTGLANAYTTRANTTTLTKRSWQVVRVPQYSVLTLGGGLTMQPWNGSTGGLLVLEATGDINLAGQTINGSGRGFRGGGAVNVDANAACTANYNQLTNPCNNYVAGIADSLGGSKGEGIAGTPGRIYNGDPTGGGGGAVTAGTVDGYPGGEAARGAPGNAGGGGNQHNAGGGGGANGGAGGQGGNTWNSSVDTFVGLVRGGFGGAPFASSATRLLMGGGGGAGDIGGNGTTTPQGSGGAGGGIVIVRASRILGNGATISVNGAPGINTNSTDATGGGGAGGTVVLTASTAAVVGGLTVNAAGARGGNYTQNVAEQDGAGGGGGGGYLLGNVSGVTAVLIAGAAGTSASTACDAGADCGMDPGAAGTGTAASGYTGSASGVSIGYECLPNITITKITSTPLVTASTGATASWVVTLSNSGGGARFITLDDFLPPGWGFADGTQPIYAPAVAGQLPTGAETVALAHTAPWSVGALPLSFPTTPVSNITVSSFAMAPVRQGVPSAMTFTFVASIPDTATVGTYHNAIGLEFLDPTRAAASTRVVSPQTNVAANRTATAYAPNTYNNYNGAATTNVAGSNYDGLATGPTGEDVRLVPDFSITKTAPASVTPQATFSYVITARNNGRPIAAQVFATTQATSVPIANVPATFGSSPLTVTDTFTGSGVTLTTAFTGTGWTCSGTAPIVCTLANGTAYPVANGTNFPPLSATAMYTPTCAVSTASVTNTVRISAGAGEAVSSNNTDTAVVSPGCVTANISITKTNGTASVLVGSSASYTVTVSNLGPGNAPGMVVTDPAVTGLSCSVVTCSVNAGTAVCPASPTVAALQGSGLVIPTLNAASTLSFVVGCSVTATGL